ncbi:hypothetical protein [Bacillus sp. OK048]|uniref:hypothetical protein n=1 Tax=Bacillus sp. OK048 TaxID=1882761 RepID=UPI001C315332|nr:hypothetical protein [Bacillus sp. OK048]
MLFNFLIFYSFNFKFAGLLLGCNINGIGEGDGMEMNETRGQQMLNKVPERS